MAAESNRTARTIAIRRGIGLTAFAVVLTSGLTSGRAPGLAPGFGLATVHAQLQARHIDVTGSVKDPHGDSIVGAKIVLLRADRPGGSLVGESTSDDSGRFRFSGLGEGAYTLTVSSDGFSPAEEALTLRAGLSPPSLSIVLQPTIKDEVLLVEADKGVSLDPVSAAGAKVLKEKDLRALPDDPDQLSARLQLLASSSGSAPGQATVTVDGFLNEGRLPPKSSIREVRINPDLFSAEYDKAPYHPKARRLSY